MEYKEVLNYISIAEGIAQGALRLMILAQENVKTSESLTDEQKKDLTGRLDAAIKAVPEWK